jgi:hypothetical protein
MKAMSAGNYDTATALSKIFTDCPKLKQLPDDDACKRWLQFVSEPACLENVRPHLVTAGENIISCTP